MSLTVVIGALLVGCTSKEKAPEVDPQKSVTENQPSPTQTPETEPNSTENADAESAITKEMAYEGVNNYCHSEFDWSMAEENPEIMYVELGEETATEYQVVFRSYTGSLRYFYVDKTTGSTRMVDIVPNIAVEEDAGTININDYLKNNN